MTRIAAIPLSISEILIPEDSLNVVDLSTFPVPSDKNAPKLLDLTDDMLFLETASLIQDEQRVAFLQSLAMPTGEETLEIRKRRGVALEANQTIQSLVYPHGNMDICLPLWIVEYWLEANYILEAKIQWQCS
ncbi:hypothetical protein CPB84DRAFT_1822166 [Gymnopilus junonius]|uniref:Uncharacterized protein n=1 Tax=Gymnopilus junonius TaxID=109634 RepID=A0A9P5NWF2_GYMJU|nr:hypothetical protein CPB84DRAFT_1822166 [Gymnopilus junonius]